MIHSKHQDRATGGTLGSQQALLFSYRGIKRFGNSLKEAAKEENIFTYLPSMTL